MGAIFSIVSIASVTPIQQQTYFQLAVDFDPPNRGAPGDRGGDNAGSRDDSCNLLAMVPKTNLGLTTAEHPAFWLYVPTVPKSPRSLELVLRDESDREIYRTTFELTQGDGIVSFRLPETAPPLDVGQLYHWHVFCGNFARDGWIERVAFSPEVESQLETATPRERVLIFAEQGLWYETLTELAGLRCSDPQNTQLLQDWASLLQHEMVTLNEIVSASLLSCGTQPE